MIFDEKKSFFFTFNYPRTQDKITSHIQPFKILTKWRETEKCQRFIAMFKLIHKIIIIIIITIRVPYTLKH